MEMEIYLNGVGQRVWHEQQLFLLDIFDCNENDDDDCVLRLTEELLTRHSRWCFIFCLRKRKRDGYKNNSFMSFNLTFVF